jgi:ABC-type transport system involved in multi-copper enzyme maturation permease subunit
MMHGTLTRGGPAWPDFATLLTAELTALWLRGRRSMLAYALTLTVLLAFVSLTIRLQMAAEPGTITDTFSFSGGPIAFVPVLLGILWALWAWRGEPPSRRGYFFSAPASRFEHSLARVAAGWLWLLACVVLYVLGVALFATVTYGADSLLRQPSWMWAGVFVSATIAYLLTVPIALLTERPESWVIGSMLLILLLPAVLHLAGLVTLLELYGRGLGTLAAALSGNAPPGAPGLVTSYAGAVVVWTGIGMAVVIAATKHFHE